MAQLAQLTRRLRQHQSNDPALALLVRSLEQYEKDHNLARLFPGTVSRLFELFKEYCPGQAITPIPHARWDGSLPQTLLLTVLWVSQYTPAVQVNFPKLQLYRWTLPEFEADTDTDPDKISRYQQRMYLDILDQNCETIGAFGPPPEMDLPSDIQQASLRVLAHLEVLHEASPEQARVSIRQKIMRLLAQFNVYRHAAAENPTAAYDSLLKFLRSLAAELNLNLEQLVQNEEATFVEIIYFDEVLKSELDSEKTVPNYADLCKIVKKHGRWFVHAFEKYLARMANEKDESIRKSFSNRMLGALNAIEKAAGPRPAQTFLAAVNAC